MRYGFPLGTAMALPVADVGRCYPGSRPRRWADCARRAAHLALILEHEGRLRALLHLRDFQEVAVIVRSFGGEFSQLLAGYVKLGGDLLPVGRPRPHANPVPILCSAAPTVGSTQP